MLTSLPMSNRKSQVCPECGKPRKYRCTYCAKCAASRKSGRIKASNKLRAKNHNEKSTFLESRSVKAFCPKCEEMGRNPYHKIKVKVQKHVVLPKKYRKFCKFCNQIAERDYTPEPHNVVTPDESGDWT